jgi:hypothetical protein
MTRKLTRARKNLVKLDFGKRSFLGQMNSNCIDQMSFNFYLSAKSMPSALPPKATDCCAAAKCRFVP